MDAAKKILSAKGVDDPVEDMELGQRYEIPADDTLADMDLTIEKVGQNEVSVAHYYTQRMDLMRDPEIVYRIDGDDWTAIEYRQDPGIYQRDESGLPDVESFGKTWSKNLQRQGFVPDDE